MEKSKKIINGYICVMEEIITEFIIKNDEKNLCEKSKKVLSESFELMKLEIESLKKNESITQENVVNLENLVINFHNNFCLLCVYFNGLSQTQANMEFEKILLNFNNDKELLKAFLKEL